MTEYFKWDPTTLSVKVANMDQEHQILINKMNKLHEVYAGGGTKEQLAPLVKDFAAYVVTHFQDEEAYMEKIKFEGVETHKLIHKQLLSQATEHIQAFEATGKLTDAFFKFLSVWLTSHIKGIDMKYSGK